VAAGRGLIATVVLLAAAGRVAAACDEERARTGIEATVRVGQLVVSALAPQSPGATSGLAPDDVLVQANATLLRACSDWARAVRDARRDHKALLLLVRRGERETAVALPADVWGPPPASAPARAEARGARTFSAAPLPPPLPPEVPVSIPAVVQALARLVPADPERASLPAYRARVADVRQQIETLAARHAASAEWLAELRRVIHLHEAAEVAWTAVEAARERDHRPRHLPFPEESTTPYFEDSAPAAVIDELPQLRPTVAREPTPGIVGESAGLWRPLVARRLLWEQARTEGAALATRPGAQGP
jgi:hypothetical protein